MPCGPGSKPISTIDSPDLQAPRSSIRIPRPSLNPFLRHPAIPWLAAVLSGVLLALCYPGWDQAWLIWFWQAPLLLVLWLRPEPPGARRVLWGARLGYVAGLTFFLISLVWLRFVAWPGLILLSAYLALYFAAFGAFTATIGRLRPEKITPGLPEPAPPSVHSSKLRALIEAASKPALMEPSLHTIHIATLNAAAWVALEYLRGIFLTGFGWNGLGVALHESVYLIQIADVVGVTGLAFLVVFINVVAVSTVARFTLELGEGRLRPHADFAAAMLLLILVFFYGVNTLQRHPIDDPVSLSAVLVQGNISIDDRYDRSKYDGIRQLYEDLTSLYADQDYDLIVWPETALPHTFYERSTLDYLTRILRQGDFHLLIGNEQAYPGDSGELEVYNSMILLRENVESYQAYQKIHRVPFGEYIPFRDGFPLFRWALGRLIPEDFDAGSSTNRLQLHDPPVEIIPAICFEDTLGRLTRRFFAEPGRGAQLIVNLTNDAWFGPSDANWQHLANAKFRCVELKRPMIRCANTGITAVVNRFGSLADPESVNPHERRVFLDDATGSPFLAGCYPVRLELDSKPSLTFFAKHGDVFSWAMLAFITLRLTIPAIQSRLPKQPDSPSRLP